MYFDNEQPIPEYASKTRQQKVVKVYNRILSFITEQSLLYP